MLVLTRKVGEKILIGDDITITVIDIGKSRLKVGIEAPSGHRILRSELVADPDQPGAPCGEVKFVVRTEAIPRRRSRDRSRPAVAAVGI